MNVDVAAASWEPVVLLVPEVVVFIVATRRTTASPPHALEPVAIPTLTAARGFILMARKIASRRAIHGYTARTWVAVLALVPSKPVMRGVALAALPGIRPGS